MKKTNKMAALRQPHNYWIERRVWADDNGNEFVKINGCFFDIDWLFRKGWEISIAW